MKKDNAVRTTISITPSVYAKAQEVMRLRSFSKFSTLLHQLIREEWERRRGSSTSIPEPEPTTRRAPVRLLEHSSVDASPKKKPRNRP